MTPSTAWPPGDECRIKNQNTLSKILYGGRRREGSEHNILFSISLLVLHKQSPNSLMLGVKFSLGWSFEITLLARALLSNFVCE